ncbi:MAG: hypothetical protein M1828_003231 [Chrysothrix sp. TS-e1954]|nr:MAG: hypothetical protein M1828_003231 [Chrysothrix sp. TS-e1954]
MASTSLPLRLARKPRTDLLACRAAVPKTFSTKSFRAAKRDEDPMKALEDMISPSKTVRRAPSQSQSQSESLASRHPQEPVDASNPGLSGYPSRDGTLTNSQSPPSPPNRAINNPRQPASESTPPTSRNTNPFVSTNATSASNLMKLYEEGHRDTAAQTLHRRSAQPTPRLPPRPQPSPTAARDTLAYHRQVEGQANRPWPPGFVYAPKDLSHVESLKTKNARFPSKFPRALNSRNRGWTDAFEEAGVKPMAEWKNFSLMSEFVSETGRIKSARETGLKAVNQRRMAKAVRRAVGTGLFLPSCYRHPELIAERRSQREGLSRRTFFSR